MQGLFTSEAMGALTDWYKNYFDVIMVFVARCFLEVEDEKNLLGGCFI